LLDTLEKTGIADHRRGLRRIGSCSESRRTTTAPHFARHRLPSLNGIEVAQRVRKLSAESKILFVSQESSADVVQEALDIGAHGYVVKIDAGSELPEGVNAVLRGGRFVGRRFSGHDFIGASDAGASPEFRTNGTSALL
jgi:DNA-binding NarL/FixJ family response regulator